MWRAPACILSHRIVCRLIVQWRRGQRVLRWRSRHCHACDPLRRALTCTLPSRSIRIVQWWWRRVLQWRCRHRPACNSTWRAFACVRSPACVVAHRIVCMLIMHWWPVLRRRSCGDRPARDPLWRAFACMRTPACVVARRSMPRNRICEQLWTIAARMSRRCWQRLRWWWRAQGRCSGLLRCILRGQRDGLGLARRRVVIGRFLLRFLA